MPIDNWVSIGQNVTCTDLLITGSLIAPTSGGVAVVAGNGVSGNGTSGTPLQLDFNRFNTFGKAQNVAMVALTDGASIATDASLSNSFSVTLGGNRTLANPTNLVAGGVYTWVVTQDGTGGRTLAYGNAFTWIGGAAPVLSTAANAVDLISAIYDGSKLRASIQKAFA